MAAYLVMVSHLDRGSDCIDSWRKGHCLAIRDTLDEARSIRDTIQRTHSGELRIYMSESGKYDFRNPKDLVRVE